MTDQLVQRLRELHRPRMVEVPMRLKPKAPTVMETVVVCASCDAAFTPREPARYPCPTARLLDELGAGTALPPVV